MTMRAIVLVLLAVALVTAGPGAASAHHGSEDNPTGVLAVPARGEASLPVENCNAGDTLQWTWTATSGAAPQISTLVVWTDAAGRERHAEADPIGQAFGSFTAPADLRSVRLVWRNTGEIPTVIRWTYGASASFWLRPDMFLPAMIPVLLLVVCLLGGRILDVRRRARLRAPATPSGAAPDPFPDLPGPRRATIGGE